MIPISYKSFLESKLHQHIQNIMNIKNIKMHL